MRIVWDRLEPGPVCRGDIICSDPPLVKPATPTEMDKPVIDNFNFHPASGSPAVGPRDFGKRHHDRLLWQCETKPAFDWCCRTRSLRNAANGLTPF